MTVTGGQEAGGEGPWRVNIISRMLEASSPWREIQLTDRASTGTNNKHKLYMRKYIKHAIAQLSCCSLQCCGTGTGTGTGTVGTVTFLLVEPEPEPGPELVKKSEPVQEQEPFFRTITFQKSEPEPEP